MAKSALPWLQRLCALYEKHEPSVYGCTAEVHSSGVLVSLELDRGSVHLLAQPKARSGAYASTASMDIAIHHPAGAGPMPGNGELVARQFIALLQRADKGDIRIQSHGVNTAPVSDEPVHANAEEAEEARQDYAAELHRASFLALQIHQAKEHPAGLASPENTEDPHHFLYAALKTGFSRRDFQGRFGMGANDVAPQAFEILLALGVMTIDGDQVAHKASTAHELATYQTFFLSQEDQARLQTGLTEEYDADADYAQLLAEALGSEG